MQVSSSGCGADLSVGSGQRLLQKLAAVFLAFCLVLTLQTKLRGPSGLGPGEIGLAIYAISFITAHALVLPRLLGKPTFRFVLLFSCWALLVLTPVTLIMSAADTPGSSVRDLVAILLSLSIVVAAALQRDTLPLVGQGFVIFLLISLVGQYLFGGSGAWFHDVRFTAGAKNPNQLALYLVCAEVFVALFMSYRLVVFAIFLLFGVLSGSDAYIISRVFMLGTFVMMFVFRHARISTPFSILILVIFGVPLVLYLGFLDLLTEVWANADEGEARVNTFLNGLKAWLDTPFSLLIGNGAGSFSGYSGPFESYEAHNTPIDMLSIGGPLAVALVYAPLLRLIFNTYPHNRDIVAATAAGLVIFTLFHFVGRQPVFWVTIYASSYATVLVKREMS